ncbi:hypothetical protein [Thiocapsa rosea]|uniref:Uncharacterized protein n=1 Tax=Thiocapsa rosea TaxID=69360 RepID=A0A495V4K4_9GAMM|nr:hypothetical protein [Thiocapsa rosea]RKT43543.1 hypothetical protein BDD21_0882 [Thiocapsa rosea]
MARKKLLNKLARFFDADRAAQRKEIDSILKVTKKLKIKERELREKLTKTPAGEEHDEIAGKLDVIEAQRNKALKLIQELRAGPKKDSA